MKSGGAESHLMAGGLSALTHVSVAHRSSRSNSWIVVWTVAVLLTMDLALMQSTCSSDCLFGDACGLPCVPLDITG